MLRVRSGLPFPDLEQALRGELERHVAKGDFSRLALVVPSREARRGLRLLIGREWGLSCLGVRLSTAYDFALNTLAGSPGRPVHIAPAGMLAVLVRELVRAGGYDELGTVIETAGGADSVLSSLLAMREAGAPAGSPGKKASEILRLYARFEAGRAERGLAVPADVVAGAADAAAESGFVSSFESIVNYGFGDMTGVQMRLLAALAEFKPVDLFLPCGRGPVWNFAREFAGRLRSAVAADVKTEPLESAEPRPLLEPAISRLFGPEAAPDPAGPFPARTVTVSGTEAEVRAAAREILRLVEDPDDPVAFEDIALAARSLEPCVPWMEGVLAEHGIPFRSSAAWPGAAFPAVKAVHSLARVFESGMARADVIDLLSSPFFAAERFGAEAGWSCYWDLLTRDRGVVGGEDWDKLEGLLARARAADDGGDDDEEDRRVPLHAPKIEALARAAASLAAASARLPEAGRWDELAAAFLAAFNDHVDFSRDGIEESSGGLCAEVRRVVQGMRDFDRAAGRATREEFFSALRAELDSLTARLGGDGESAGVEVLDAMALRCRSFRAVVLIGMHEGGFPRPVRQDPFLGDAARAELGRRHGLHFPLKEAGYLEERLLFALALSAARERLTVIRQRSDDEGRPLVPSWYLQELRRAGGAPPESDDLRVPRRLGDRLASPEAPVTARERLRGLVHSGVRSRRAWKTLAADPLGLEKSLTAADELAAPAGKLGPRDGIVGALEWCPPEEKLSRGLSASFLQRYARCPFLFFAERVLEVTPVEEPEGVEEIGPLEYGSILHAVLQGFFERVITDGRLPEDPDSLLEESLRRELGDFARANPTGWPLLWARACRQIGALAAACVAAELAEMRESGFRPAAAEGEESAKLPDRGDFPESVRGLALFGRIDRLDERAADAGRELRVVDYKFTGAARVITDLAPGAVTGRTLQPPLYLLLAPGLAGGKGISSVSAEFHYVAPNASNGPFAAGSFPGGCWKGDLGRQVAEAIDVILSGIRRGEFFVRPDDWACRSCEFAALCRKSHRATRYRLAADRRPGALDDLAEVRPAESGGGGGKRRGRGGKKR